MLSSGEGTKPSCSFSRRIGWFRSSLSVTSRRKPAFFAAAISARFNAVATPRRREPVVRLVAEDLQGRVADDVVARERDEAELGPAGRPVDLVGAPLLERRDAFRAGDVLPGLDGDDEHLLE